jgi:hypothetical protein
METATLQSQPSDPNIDIASHSHHEQDRRLIAQPQLDAAEIPNPGDSVRIERAPRAQTNDREMLRQPWPAE